MIPDELVCSVDRLGDDWIWFVTDQAGAIQRRGFADTRADAREKAKQAKADLANAAAPGIAPDQGMGEQ